MVVLVPRRKQKLYSQSIERDAPKRFGVPKRPFHKYFTVERALRYLEDMDQITFFVELYNDKRLLGFKLDNGDIYIHPDGLIALIKRRGSRLCRRMVGKLKKLSRQLTEQINRDTIECTPTSTPTPAKQIIQEQNTITQSTYLNDSSESIKE